MRKQSGFTLIETMIYLALFSIIIGGSMITAYSIIENSDKTQAQVVLQEEANFMLRKLDWAITGSSSITLPMVGSSGTGLELTKSIGTIEFQLNGNKLQIKKGAGAFLDLNNANVTIDSLFFAHVAGGGGKPESVVTTFVLVDNYGHNQTFSQTKYLRK
ncbi:MAG: type II secretion system protein [Patescibacteria group bacterium]